MRYTLAEGSGTTTLEPTGSASADPPPFAKGRCYNNFRTHTDANNPTARFVQREMHDVTVTDAKLHTSLSQREVARRSRDGGFNGSCDTPLRRGVARQLSNPPARLAPTHLPLRKGGVALPFVRRGGRTSQSRHLATIPPFAKGKYLLYNKSSFSGRSADGSAQRSGR